MFSRAGRATSNQFIAFSSEKTKQRYQSVNNRTHESESFQIYLHYNLDRPDSNRYLDPITRQQADDWDKNDKSRYFDEFGNFKPLHPGNSSSVQIS